MNLIKLSRSYVLEKPLSSFLSILLFTLGTAIIVVLLLFSSQLEEKLTKNAEGINLVVGAKGSPLQIILCNIFHIDFPTGNINLVEAEQLASNNQIKKAIPLALGDSYKGIRVIGCTMDYPKLYGAELEAGNFWKGDLEVVLGSGAARNLGLSINDAFFSQHGMDEEGYGHEEASFKVVGILNFTGTVLDNLILTSIPSIWEVHETHEEESHEGHHLEEDTDHEKVMSRLIPGVDLAGMDSTRQITSLLIQFRSPMGAVMLPRMINQNTNMQAASPAFETARLFNLIGVGVDVLRWFAIIIIIISALSIFVALYNSLKERKYDLSIMRSMGATRIQVFNSIILEGMLITIIGSVLGLIAGHLIIELINTSVPASEQSGIRGDIFYLQELYIILFGVLIGLLAAVIPAIQAMKTDISKTLSKG